MDSLALAAADDIEILEHARADAAVIVSADTDFGTLLGAQRATLPSVILTREVSTMPAAELLVDAHDLSSLLVMTRSCAVGIGQLSGLSRRFVRFAVVPSVRWVVRRVTVGFGLWPAVAIVDSIRVRRMNRAGFILSRSGVVRSGSDQGVSRVKTMSWRLLVSTDSPGGCGKSTGSRRSLATVNAATKSLSAVSSPT